MFNLKSLILIKFIQKFQSGQRHPPSSLENNNIDHVFPVIISHNVRSIQRTNLEEVGRCFSVFYRVEYKYWVVKHYRKYKLYQDSI